MVGDSIQWMVYKSRDNSMTNGNVKSSLLREIYPFVSGPQLGAGQQMYVSWRREKEESWSQVLRKGKDLLENGFEAMSQP